MTKRKLALPTLLLALAITFMVAGPRWATAQPMYNVISLGFLPDGRDFLSIDLNNRGEVLGYPLIYVDGSRNGQIGEPYIWRNGQWTALPQPTNGTITWDAIELNNRGQILGKSRPPGNSSGRPFIPIVWDNGVATEVPFSFPSDFRIRGFNDGEDFVGAGSSSSGPRAFIDGQERVLPHLFPDAYAAGSAASDINNQGVIIGTSGAWNAGTHAVRWVNVQVENLGTLDPSIPIGEQYNIPSSINDQGVIVGVSNEQPFMWKNGVMSPLLIPNEPITGPLYTPQNSTFDINNQGIIVGNVETASSGLRNVLWDSQGGAVVLFNDLLEEQLPNWEIHQIYAINDDGWIVGAGIDASARVQSFLLVPIPEPSSWALLAIGLVTASVVSRQVRRKSRERVRKPDWRATP